jgi:hypothetical protein
MTHPDNTFCPWARNVGVDIIRAEGAQVPCIQQACLPTADPVPDAAPANAPIKTSLVGHFW